MAASTSTAGALPRAAATNSSPAGPARPSAPASSTAVSLWAVRLMPRSRLLTDPVDNPAASASSSWVSPASARSCRNSPANETSRCPATAQRSLPACPPGNRYRAEPILPPQYACLAIPTISCHRRPACMLRCLGSPRPVAAGADHGDRQGPPAGACLSRLGHHRKHARRFLWLILRAVLWAVVCGGCHRRCQQWNRPVRAPRINRRETAMNLIHAVRRPAGIGFWLASVVLASLSAAAPAALATPRPRPPGWNKHPPVPVGTRPVLRFPPG